MSKFIMLFSVVALMSSAVSFAQSKDGGKGGKGQQPGHVQKPVTWDELKGRCQDPNSYQDLQGVTPTNIVLECQQNLTHFVAAAPGEVALPGRATLTTSVVSDKFTVAPETSDMDMAAKAGACQRFVEVVESYSVPRSVSCSEIMNGKNGGAEVRDYCQESVSKGKDQNPKGVVVVQTGRYINTCDASNIQVGKAE